MKAIFRGRRHDVVSRTQHGVWLRPCDRHAELIHVVSHDPDLIVDSSSDDLYLAEAFECGEIGAFEYPDGHTYPPNHEIPPRTTWKGSTKVH